MNFIDNSKAEDILLIYFDVKLLISMCKSIYMAQKFVSYVCVTRTV
jgi:hypothetical protein